MWTQAWRLAAYMEGEMKESEPFVEKVMSDGLMTDEGLERSLTAWAIVGWYRPPCGECHSRCVGSTWP